MLKSNNISVKALKLSVAIIALLAIVHLVLQFININYLNQSFGNFYEVTNRFDFDDEASIPTWYSQLLFLFIASLAFVTAYLERKKKSKLVWITIAIVSVLGSLDEVSTIHETGLQGLHLLFFNEDTPTLIANAWILILPLVLVFYSIFIYKSGKVLPKKTIKLLFLSTTIYLVGAIGVDILTSTLETTNQFLEQGILVAIEEIMELIGLSLVIYTILDYLEDNHSKKINQVFKILKD
jgi:uncharacterized protein with PQ loop repeat